MSAFDTSFSSCSSCAERNSTRRRPARHGGFTLIEMLLAISLLAMMMGMIYASLSVGIRAWDAGDGRVAEASNWRMVERFMRREFAQVFPTRWRGVAQPNIAFEGTASTLRYVSALNLDAAQQNGASGGLQWAELALLDGGILQLNRQTFDNAAQDFSGLVAPSADAIANGALASPVRLMDGVRSLEIAYFGADSDLAEPTWRDEWRDMQRLPALVRVQVNVERGRSVPPIVLALKTGEEAGCMQTNFTRQCSARVR